MDFSDEKVERMLNVGLTEAESALRKLSQSKKVDAKSEKALKNLNLPQTLNKMKTIVSNLPQETSQQRLEDACSLIQIFELTTGVSRYLEREINGLEREFDKCLAEVTKSMNKAASKKIPETKDEPEIDVIDPRKLNKQLMKLSLPPSNPKLFTMEEDVPLPSTPREMFGDEEIIGELGASGWDEAMNAIFRPRDEAQQRVTDGPEEPPPQMPMDVTDGLEQNSEQPPLLPLQQDGPVVPPLPLEVSTLDQPVPLLELPADLQPLDLTSVVQHVSLDDIPQIVPVDLQQEAQPPPQGRPKKRKSRKLRGGNRYSKTKLLSEEDLLERRYISEPDLLEEEEHAVSARERAVKDGAWLNLELNDDFHIDGDLEELRLSYAKDDNDEATCDEDLAIYDEDYNKRLQSLNLEETRSSPKKTEEPGPIQMQLTPGPPLPPNMETPVAPQPSSMVLPEMIIEGEEVIQNQPGPVQNADVTVTRSVRLQRDPYRCPSVMPSESEKSLDLTLQAKREESDRTLREKLRDKKKLTFADVTPETASSEDKTIAFLSLLRACQNGEASVSQTSNSPQDIYIQLRN